ncbi:MAG: MBL fold metallo-hydrolase [Thermomicrobia bacterium]|nr:MBL fold metallo-hydrolase [Thermomicrobia bacterium]MCA1724517.1 MBL fold metallo-hydrolase [Thermomicrobia bacterium]
MTDLQLTVIGCSAAMPRPGSACSSYLVTYGALHVLMDCGPGALSFLRAEINPRNLDAIVLSHLHADHTLDLVPLAYGLLYGPREGDERKPRGERLALFVPPGGKKFLTGLARAVEGGGRDRDFWGPFAIAEYDPDGTLVVGSDSGGDADYLTFRFAPTKHYIPCQAIKVTPPGDDPHPTLVYGADSAPVDSLTEFAHGADLLILEATLDTPETPAPVGHMTPRQAATLATDAGDVKRLLLTHYWGHVPPETMIAEAREAFAGPISVAKERDTYIISEE